MIPTARAKSAFRSCVGALCIPHLVLSIVVSFAFATGFPHGPNPKLSWLVVIWGLLVIPFGGAVEWCFERVGILLPVALCPVWNWVASWALLWLVAWSWGRRRHARESASEPQA